MAAAPSCAETAPAASCAIVVTSTQSAPERCWSVTGRPGRAGLKAPVTVTALLTNVLGGREIVAPCAIAVTERTGVTSPRAWRRGTGASLTRRRAFPVAAMRGTTVTRKAPRLVVVPFATDVHRLPCCCWTTSRRLMRGDDRPVSTTASPGTTEAGATVRLALGRGVARPGSAPAVVGTAITPEPSVANVTATVTARRSPTICAPNLVRAADAGAAEARACSSRVRRFSRIATCATAALRNGPMIGSSPESKNATLIAPK